MTLCVCGHPSADHAQFDHGEYCFSCSCRDWRPIHREAVDSEESTASLSAGVTPEGLAEQTISGYVNPDGSGKGNWAEAVPAVNEAAEALREWFRGEKWPGMARVVEAALESERRSTVERIRARVEAEHTPSGHCLLGSDSRFYAILHEVAS